MRRNYNYQRTKLHIPEYGRHIHSMIEYVMAIQDKETRSKQAKAVIAVMGNINPLLRDTPEFTHKLWDHLFIMADFQLDIDSPYPIPTAKTLTLKPNKMPYPRKKVKMKHYGRNIERTLMALTQSDNKSGVEVVIDNIAKYMRTKSYEYNHEHPSNSIIIRDIKRLSENLISLDEDAIGNIKSEYKSPQTSYQKNKINRGKPNKNVKPSNKPQFRPRPNK